MPKDLSGRVLPLGDAHDPSLFGGKAAQLAVAVSHGLAVPDGVAIPWPLVEAVTAGDEGAIRAVVEGCASLQGPLAVSYTHLTLPTTPYV